MCRSDSRKSAFTLESMDGKFVAALDVGTTTVRCHILDQSTATLGTSTDKVDLLYPEIGHEEIEPEQLWEAIVKVIRGAVKAAGITPGQITCLGVSTQRSSFVTWHRDTGKPFHNFITWKDARADRLVRQWNGSFTMWGLRAVAWCAYTITRSKRFLAGSVLRLMNSQVTLRLAWVLQNVPALRDAAARGQAMFGTVDTWLLYRLSGRALHVTDVSNASATGFFDPFTMQWSRLALALFQLSADMLPAVWDTAADFGHVSEHIFGARIPIRCMIADQAASTFGSCCFDEGDVKVTMGTGTFLNVNTGQRAHASVAGLYPLVGWRIGTELVYLVEGSSHDTGTIINWAINVGLLNDPSESSHLATSVKDSGGVYFIPAFSGLQAPINDFQAAAGLLGVKPTTSRGHMMRAMLESIVFRVMQLYQTLQEEADYRYSRIRVDGGVSRNDFVMQLLADLTGLNVERSPSAEMSILGAAFLAGLSAGVWQSKDELRSLREVERVFQPQKPVSLAYHEVIMLWNQAVQRFLGWYPLPVS